MTGEFIIYLLFSKTHIKILHYLFQKPFACAQKFNKRISKLSQHSNGWCESKQRQANVCVHASRTTDLCTSSAYATTATPTTPATRSTIKVSIIKKRNRMKCKMKSEDENQGELPLYPVHIVPTLTTLGHQLLSKAYLRDLDDLLAALQI